MGELMNNSKALANPRDTSLDPYPNEPLELHQKEVEELTQQELMDQVPDSNHSPADIAAAFFSMNEKKLNNLLRRMSVRQLRRVIMSVASYPLKGEYNPKSNEEKGVAYIFSEMMFNKSIMTLQLEAERVEDAQKREQENLKETNKLIEGDIKNG